MGFLHWTVVFSVLIQFIQTVLWDSFIGQSCSQSSYNLFKLCYGIPSLDSRVLSPHAIYSNRVMGFLHWTVVFSVLIQLIQIVLWDSFTGLQCIIPQGIIAGDFLCAQQF